MRGNSHDSYPGVLSAAGLYCLSLSLFLLLGGNRAKFTSFQRQGESSDTPLFLSKISPPSMRYVTVSKPKRLLVHIDNSDKSAETYGGDIIAVLNWARRNYEGRLSP